MNNTESTEITNVPGEESNAPATHTELDHVAREFNNTLYTQEEDGSSLTVSPFEYTPLDQEIDTARLLVLHPTDNAANHVRCDIESHPLTDLPPYIAIKNARGYRNLKECIEINGQALSVSIALERFLRYHRTLIKEPTRIWVRCICVKEFNADEQKKYWTREFSDKMYALAREVFDMHEVNSRLIETGYYERVVDSRYASWTKEWYGSPEKTVLPNVCPVRLGTKPGKNIPTAKYQYMSLDMIADEIRIMCIMPAENVTAPIVMHAAHCPVKCEVTFTALSYRWGTDEAPVEIVLNGQKKLIRKNLAEAIRAVRMPNGIVPLWIDAMSINQDDVIERGRQVARMGAIYENATVIISHVGEQATDTALALEFMHELTKHPMIRKNDKGEFHFGPWQVSEGNSSYGENRIKPEQLGPRCAAVYRFLTKQYFQRCWILQEVAWASNPVIIAGKGLQIHLEDLDKATYNLQDMLIRDSTLAGRMREADPSLTNIDINMLAFPRKLFYFRHLISGGARYGTDLQFAAIKETAPGFLEALVLARDFQCVDPRDHIFALWNLARDKTGLDFRPSYEKKYEEVYADFTREWILQHGTLDMLGAVEAAQKSNSFYQNVPSWCPDWNAPATASCLVRKDYIPTRMMFALDDQDGALYSADGDMNCDSFDNHPLFSFEGNTLHCTGTIIDQINFILDDAPEIPTGTKFPRCDRESNWRYRCWTEELERHYKKKELSTYDDPLQAACAMFHGDMPTAWPLPKDSGYSTTAYDSDEQYVCLPQLARHVLKYADSYDRTSAWGVVKSVLRGRRPFVSDKGYMGLAPDFVTGMDSSKPWLLAVVAGCSVPLLLREREDKGAYQLIGTCFVQGWMEGEWMDMIKGARSPTEFWDAIKDDTKLKIW